MSTVGARALNVLSVGEIIKIIFSREIDTRIANVR